MCISRFSLRRRELQISNFRRTSKVRKDKSEHRQPTTTNRGGRSRKNNTQKQQKNHKGPGLLNLATRHATRELIQQKRSHCCHRSQGRTTKDESEDNHAASRPQWQSNCRRRRQTRRYRIRQQAIDRAEQRRPSISQHDHSGDKHPPSLQGGQASTEQNNHDSKEPASKPQNSDDKASAETTTTNREQDDRAAKHPPRPRQPR
jgi:hypothetical protein